MNGCSCKNDIAWLSLNSWLTWEGPKCSDDNNKYYDDNDKHEYYEAD